MCEADALTEVTLEVIGKDERQYQRAQGDAGHVQEDGEEAPEQHDEDVELGVRHTERADIADTTRDTTALIVVATKLIFSERSAAGFPRMRILYQ